ncbi:hypothetical protein ACTMTJ_45075 [Phytohabitans sp. LJ34]|uniref:hypothetical protein n=1 Tax=Phytohabitans sp. LJ34 TaxID=3452217 RepID=UPI003F8A29AB
MNDMLSACLAEFDALRQELNARLAVSYTLLTLELAAVGTGVSIATANSHVLAGLAILTVLLWLFWIDNSTMVQSIGAYIAIDLAPRLTSAGVPIPLRWEAYMRQLHSGGTSASQVLFGRNDEAEDRGLRRSAGSDWYTSVLFGGSSPTLLFAYMLNNSPASATGWLLMGLLGLGVFTMWVYAAATAVRFHAFLRLIRRAILDRAAESTPDHQQGSGMP